MLKKRNLILAAAILIFMLLFPTGLITEVKGKVYEGHPPTKENICLYTVSLLGVKSRLPSESYDMETLCYGNVDVVKTSWMYLCGRKNITVVPVRDLSAEYDAKAYTGDRFSALNVSCTAEYADGRKETIKDFCIKNAPDSFVGVRENISVGTKYGPAEMTVSPVRLISIETDQKDVLYQYDIPDFTSIRFIYADGTTRMVSKNNVNFTTDPDQPLEKLGSQKLLFTYKGFPYVLHLTAMKNTNVTNAVRANREEIKDAEYFYLSDTLYVAVNHYDNRLGFYYLSHVVVNDPSQIVSALSYDTWGGKRERPSSAASRLDMVIATNGSYFSYDTNTPRCAEVFIKHGKVYRSADDDGEGEPTTDGKELCLLEDGTLWTPAKGLTARDLLQKGVTDVWGAGDPLLIQDGKLYPTEHQWVNGKYPRTGIGMVRPCEYYLLTAGSGGYKGGLTFDDVQGIFKTLGCRYARTLDGGGSSTLVFNDGDGVDVINNPAGKAERPVPDFIGFCN